jgi:ribonuclease HI
MLTKAIRPENEELFKEASNTVAGVASMEAHAWFATDGSVGGGKSTAVGVRFTSLSAFLSGLGQSSDCESWSCGKEACSYRCESWALLKLLERLEWWTTEPGAELPRRATIITDAQGLLRALQKGPWSQTSACEKKIWQELIRLSRMGWEITIAFVFGHSGVPANEFADDMAKSARENAEHLPLASCWIVDTVRNRIPSEDDEDYCASSHFRVRMLPGYTHTPKEVWEMARNYKDIQGERILAQARCAAIPNIDPMPSEEPHQCVKCPLCKKVQLSTEHMFVCEALIDLKRQISPSDGVLLEAADLFNMETTRLVKAIQFVHVGSSKVLAVLRERGRFIPGPMSDCDRLPVPTYVHKAT